MQNKPHGNFVNDMIAKRHLHKNKAKNCCKHCLKNIMTRFTEEVSGGKDDNDQFKCVTVNWMRENYVDRVREWWPMRNGKLIVESEDDSGVDDQQIAKSFIQMPCHLDNYISSN